MAQVLQERRAQAARRVQVFLCCEAGVVARQAPDVPVLVVRGAGADMAAAAALRREDILAAAAQGAALAVVGRAGFEQVVWLFVSNRDRNIYSSRLALD
jgi:hypothetical protein